ncbi:MAG: HEAT repeat domain-containing protein [Blastopirellula sp. JB062]
MHFPTTRCFASTALAVSLLFCSAANADSPSVEQSIEALASTDELTQLQAIDRLAAAGPKAAAAVDPLIKLLKSPSAAVKAHAAHALGSIGSEAAPAVDALVQLAADADPQVRRQAIGAIPSLHPDRQKVVSLFVKLLGDSDPAVRLRVMHAIAETGKPALPGLIQALQNEKSAFWACLILRDMGPIAGDAAPALTKLISSAPIETRREAILSLAAMPDAAKASIPEISKALDEEHLRLAATFALGRIAQIPADVQAKIVANESAKDPVLRLVSQWALARANPQDQERQQKVLAQLAKSLVNKDAWVRSAASQALIALNAKPDQVIAELHKALPGADPAVLGDAIHVFASLGPAAIPHLQVALKNERLRKPVAAILGEMGAEAAPAVPDLVKLTSDQNPRVANEAIVALGKIGPAAKDATPRLIALLAESQGAAQHDAALALGQIGKPAADATPALQKVMSASQDETLKVLCAWSILQIDGKSKATADKVVPALTTALKAKQAVARRGAAELLGRLGADAQSAESALQAASQDEDPAVRDAVAEAREAIGKP